MLRFVYWKAATYIDGISCFTTAPKQLIRNILKTLDRHALFNLFELKGKKKKKKERKKKK